MKRLESVTALAQLLRAERSLHLANEHLKWVFLVDDDDLRLGESQLDLVSRVRQKSNKKLATAWLLLLYWQRYHLILIYWF